MTPLGEPPASPPPTPGVRLRLPVTKPRWTYTLLGIIGLIFLAMEASGGSTSTRVLIEFGANFGPLVSAGQYWRLFTANFLHIGLLHILFNGYALYWLGQEVETFYGSPRFLVIFLLSCLTGAVASFAFTYGLSAGASTGIVGLIGALIAFFYRNRKVFGKIGSTQLNNLLFIGLINLIFGLSTTGIDNWGHLGGFVGGLALGWVLCPAYRPEQQPDGSMRVVDRNSLLIAWPGVLLVAVLTVGAFLAALAMHPA